MRLTFLAAAVFGALVAAPATAEKWSLYAGTENFSIKQGARYATGSSERDFTYDAFRFNRVDFSYELVHMDDLLRDSYPGITSLHRIRSKDRNDTSGAPQHGRGLGILSGGRHSHRTCALRFFRDRRRTRVAGFRKRRGVIENGILSPRPISTPSFA